MSPLLIKNINPSYPFGIISISTLQMRKMVFRKAKGLIKSPGFLEAEPGQEPRSSSWHTEGLSLCLLSSGGFCLHLQCMFPAHCCLSRRWAACSLQMTAGRGQCQWETAALPSGACFLFMICCHTLCLGTNKQAVTAHGFKAILGAGA